MRIGDLAQRTGVSVRSLRYYEQQGMLTSERSASGQRHYDEGAVDRVLLIRQFFAAGLSSKVIAALVPHIKASSEGCPPAMLRQLTAELERIDAQAEELARARQTLNGLIKSTRKAMRGAQSRAWAPP